MNFRTLIAALAAALLFAAHANAHATLEVTAAEVNSDYKAVITVPHGCDGQATRKVKVTIPEGMISVRPMPKAGWSLETVKGDYANTYDLHGEKIKSGVKEIVWTGSLEDEHSDEFVFRGRLTDALPVGKTLFIPTVQECADGEVAWVEIPAEGQSPHDLRRPAPGLMIQAADEGHGHDTTHGSDHRAMTMETVNVGDLEISAPMIRATPPRAPVAAGYMVIRNHGDEVDRLIGGSASFAGKVEIHEMAMDGDIMRMRKIAGGLEIPTGGEVTLKPGGLHVMFMQLNEQMKEGENRQITLEFEKAGKVDLQLPVKKVERGGHGEHDGHGTSH